VKRRIHMNNLPVKSKKAHLIARNQPFVLYIPKKSVAFKYYIQDGKKGYRVSYVPLDRKEVREDMIFQIKGEELKLDYFNHIIPNSFEDIWTNNSTEITLIMDNKIIILETREEEEIEWIYTPKRSWLHAHLSVEFWHRDYHKTCNGIYIEGIRSSENKRRVLWVRENEDNIICEPYAYHIRPRGYGVTSKENNKIE
jgi:hypothetical protein